MRIINVLCFILIAISVKSENIPFELVNGLIVVEAEIDGNIGHFIMDSGSDELIINDNPIKGNTSFESINGSILSERRTIKSFKLGSIQKQKLAGYAMDLSQIETYVNRSISGIINFSIINKASVIIDFDKKSFQFSSDNVSSEIEFKNTIPFEVENGLMIYKHKQGKKSLKFILDSGATSHFIRLQSLDNYDLDYFQILQDATIYTASETTSSIKRYALIDQKIGAIEVENFLPFEYQSTENIDDNLDGLLSLRQLTNEKLYINFKNNTLQY